MLNHSLANLGTTGRKFAAGLGAVALAVTASSNVAVAQPTEPFEWTVTSPKRQPAMLNDIAAHQGATWAVGVDLIPDPELGEVRRPVIFQRVNDRWKLTPHPMHPKSTLESVAIAGPKDVWAVGEDSADSQYPKPLVMHWNGSAWRVVPGPKVPVGSLDDVQIGPDGSVWAAGWAQIGAVEHAVVYRYTGGTWQPLITGLEQSSNGNALAVVGKNEAWLGLNAGLAHFDGKRWTMVDAVPTNGSQIPSSLAATGPNDVWLVGTQHGGGPGRETCLALHYDGTSWTRVATPGAEGQLFDVTLHEGRPVAVGERFKIDGDIIQPEPIVLDHRGSGFVEAKSPTSVLGSLASVATANGRLWTAGITLDTAKGEFAAFAAYATAGR